VKGGCLEIHFGTFWKKTAKTDNFMLLIADYIPAKKKRKAGTFGVPAFIMQSRK